MNQGESPNHANAANAKSRASDLRCYGVKTRWRILSMKTSDFKEWGKSIMGDIGDVVDKLYK